MNGLKFNTGTFIALIAIALKTSGMAEGEAATLANNIVIGAGALLAAVGYIHRIIKARQPKY